MRALIVAVVLLSAVLLISSSMAFAALRQIPAIPFDLEGKKCYTYTGYETDPVITYGPNAYRQGWNITTPFVLVNEEINEVVTMMGGRLASVRNDGPATEDDYMVVFTAKPGKTSYNAFGGGAGYHGGGGVVPNTVRVILTCKVHRIKENGKYGDVVWKATETGSAKFGAAAGTIPIGSYKSTPFKMGGARVITREDAEVTAVIAARDQILARPRTTTSPNEPIGVSAIEGDLVVIDAGSTRGIRSGDTFAIYAPGSFDDNPRTGIVVDQNTDYVATVEVLTVMSHKAYCSVASGDLRSIRRGDRLVKTELPSEEAPRI